MPREWGGVIFPEVPIFRYSFSIFKQRKCQSVRTLIQDTRDQRDTTYFSLSFQIKAKGQGENWEKLRGGLGWGRKCKNKLMKNRLQSLHFFRELWQIKVIVKYSYILNKKTQVFKCCEHWTSYLSQFFVI